MLALVALISWGLILATGGQINLANTLVRSVALGMVAVGQTLVILGGSLDLSVAYQVSVTAVMASYVMQGDPDRMLLGIAVVIAIGVAVGLANGLIITGLGVNPFIATLGTALVLRGVLNASFDNFAGAVPAEFQALGYDRIGPVPYSVLLFLAVVLVAWFLLRYTRFGHHLYAVGGSEETARLSGVRSARALIGAHILCSLTAVLTGLFIVSRLRAGAPWVGPDGNYDLESIAAVVLGGTALSGGKGGVLGTVAGVLILALLDNLFNQLAGQHLPQGCPARGDHRRGGGGLRTAQLSGTRMTSTLAPRRRRFEQELTVSWRERVWRGVRGTAPIFVVLLVLLVWIAILNPNFTDPPVFLAFLKRAAPLMILAAGQLFVIVSGEFDLSVGSLDHRRRRRRGRADRRRSGPHLVGGRRSSSGWASLVGLVNGVVTTRLRVPSFITTLGMLLILQGAVLYWSGGAPRGSLPDNFRVFGRRGIEDVPVIEQLPYSVIILVVVGIAAVLLLHRTTFGKQLFAAGGNPRAAALSGVDVPLVRTLAFVLSGISAVIAGILVGGLRRHLAGRRGGVRVSGDLGGRARRRRPRRRTRLDGRRDGRGAGPRGPLHAAQLAGLPKPLRDAVQGLIIIGAVAYAAYRLRQRAIETFETSSPRKEEREATADSSVGR